MTTELKFVLSARAFAAGELECFFVGDNPVDVENDGPNDKSGDAVSSNG